jgi:periplasmic divalent cation tolerance protein
MTESKNEAIVILVTTSSVEEAERIAEILVEARVVACVNIVPGITSIFRWEGKVEHSTESLMICKTTRGQFDEVSSLVRQNHSYATPEVVAISTVEVETNYLRWLIDSVS